MEDPQLFVGVRDVGAEIKVWDECWTESTAVYAVLM